MKRSLIHAIAIIAFNAGPAWAAGGGDDSNVRPERGDPALEAIQAAVGKSDWAQARALARASIEKDAANADYHNLYAYAIRMGTKPEMELVFKHYNEALRLDPKHRVGIQVVVIRAGGVFLDTCARQRTRLRPV